ncbi:MAG: XRE family transcriptional regulator [Alphaproteobacteria bacterium]|nr:XRE family transcriptional regulator [Alphaproteobacteria bacterium]
MTKFEKSSGNVFRDLGFANADEMLAKADLARQAGKLIKQRGLTQAQVAALLKVDQPKVSALLNGRLTAFSTERLMQFLKALDQDVKIVVKPRPRSRAAQIRVAAE